MHSKPAENYIWILSKEEFLCQKEFNIEDYFSDYSSFYNQKLHFHDFYELSVVYEGNALYDINGIHVPMKRGTMQLITPAGYHRQLIQAGEYLRYFNFMFTAEMLRKLLMLAAFPPMPTFSLALKSSMGIRRQITESRFMPPGKNKGREAGKRMRLLMFLDADVRNWVSLCRDF